MYFELYLSYQGYDQSYVTKYEYLPLFGNEMFESLSFQNLGDGICNLVIACKLNKIIILFSLYDQQTISSTTAGTACTTWSTNTTDVMQCLELNSHKVIIWGIHCHFKIQLRKWQIQDIIY